MMLLKFFGSSTAKYKFSSFDLMVYISSFLVSEYYMWSVLLVMFIVFFLFDIVYIVCMLCKWLVILIKNIRGSRTMSNKILRSWVKFFSFSFVLILMLLMFCCWWCMILFIWFMCEIWIIKLYICVLNVVLSVLFVYVVLFNTSCNKYAYTAFWFFDLFLGKFVVKIFVDFM